MLFTIALHDRAAKAPAQDELELLIKEARERQLRRRLLGAAGVAIVTAVGLGVYALVIAGGGHTGSTGGSASAGAPLCRASQLAASANGLNGGGFSTMDGPATLKNVSGSACSLPTGRPRISILWRGRILPIRETKGAADGRALPVLAPHQRSAISLEWSNWCGKPSEGTVSRIQSTFLLRFGGGLSVDAPGWVATLPGCLNPGHGSVLAVSPPVRLRF